MSASASNPTPPRREIANPKLFADEIDFAASERILFQEDLQASGGRGEAPVVEDPARRYTPLRKLSEGGMKAIWEVEDHRIARRVAMALIAESRIPSDGDIESFLYEARLTANLQHPNVIPVYDVAVDPSGNPYFTMKALKGKTLAEIVTELRDGDPAARRTYTRARLLEIFLQVCNAIDYAHSKGVIHLDLKPANVMVGDFGDVHVLDWGLSTLATRPGRAEEEDAARPWTELEGVSLEDGRSLREYLATADADRRRRNRVVGGTPGYMAPEQAEGSAEAIDFRTDVHMLGAMLYELLTYRCPIEGASVADTLRKTLRGDFPPAHERAPALRVPAALSAIADKAMRTDPSERYPTVGALIRDVRKYVEGYAVSAENPTFLTHLALLVKRHKLAVGIVAGALAVIVSLVAVGFVRIRRSEREALSAKALATARMEELAEKNAYIASVARKVAPDYLDLMMRAERAYAFDRAERALDTALAFDPSLDRARTWKAKTLICQRRFARARDLLSGRLGLPVRPAPSALALAERYADRSIADADLPELARAFRAYDMGGGIPHLFYGLNREPFDPATRFPALADTLRLLNPKAKSLALRYAPAPDGTWDVAISGASELDDVSALCGLPLRALDLSGAGAIDLRLLRFDRLRDLRLSGTPVSRLPEDADLSALESLDLSGTRVRNLDFVARCARLTRLDLGGVKGLRLSAQLVWCRNLKTLLLPPERMRDPIARSLARRGVVVIPSEGPAPRPTPAVQTTETAAIPVRSAGTETNRP